MTVRPDDRRRAHTAMDRAAPLVDFSHVGTGCPADGRRPTAAVRATRRQRFLFEKITELTVDGQRWALRLRHARRWTCRGCRLARALTPGRAPRRSFPLSRRPVHQHQLVLRARKTALDLNELLERRPELVAST
jgi:hypothetical protein